MAAPNLVSPTTINGKTYPLALTNAAQDLVAAVATGHCFRCQAIYCSNITAASHIVTVNHKRSGTSVPILYQFPVPANAAVNVLDGKVIYLEEGDSLTALSDASSQIDAIATGEDLS